MTTCQSCTDANRKGYCAPLRCYCGHESCWAFASYVEPAAPDLSVIKQTRPNAWADREESTWIDQM